MVARLPDLVNFEETVMKKTLISFLAFGLFAACNPLLAEVDSKHLASVLAAQPTEEDIVWRLPQSLATSKENPELEGIKKGLRGRTSTTD